MALGNDGFVKVVKQAVDTKKYFIRTFIAYPSSTILPLPAEPSIASRYHLNVGSICRRAVSDRWHDHGGRV